MSDIVLDAFLREQLRAGLALAAESDLLELIPGGRPGKVPDRYLARFSCRGLVREPGGPVKVAESFTVGIRFPSDYLRSPARMGEVVWLLDPIHVHHPNITSGLKPGLICPGRMPSGTALVDILQQVFDIITYKKVTCREDDALNHAACSWTRENLGRLPVDDRLLRRRRLALNVDRVDGAAGVPSGAAGPSDGGPARGVAPRWTVVSDSRRAHDRDVD